MKRSRLLVLVAVAGLLAAGCGGGGEGGGNGGTATDTITMVDNAFQPTDPLVGSGSTLTLTNDGVATHTFTMEDQGIDEVIAAGEGSSVEITFDSGTYDFDCSLHPEMTGTLTVE